MDVAVAVVDEIGDPDAKFILAGTECLADIKDIRTPQFGSDRFSVDPHFCRMTHLAQIETHPLLNLVHLKRYGVVQQPAEFFRRPHFPVFKLFFHARRKLR